jgi:phospholipid transport system transporter-binding protein
MKAQCDACIGSESGFAPDAGGARWMYIGALTFAEAGTVLAASATLPLPRDGTIDCSGIGAFDSTAVAVLLAIKRRAAAEHKPVVFIGLQGRLEALAKLYDVEEMLAG